MACIVVVVQPVCMVWFGFPLGEQAITKHILTIQLSVLFIYSLEPIYLHHLINEKQNIINKFLVCIEE